MRAKQEVTFEQALETIVGSGTAAYAAAFSEEAEERAQAKKKVAEDFTEAKKNSFGFFTPYKSFTGPKGFVTSLTAPVVAPLALGLVAGVTAIGAALGTIAAVGSLLFAAGSGVVGLFNRDAKKAAQDALTFAGIAGIITAACAVITVASALIAAVVTPLLIASIFTRGGATVVSAVSDGISRCFPKSAAPEHHEVNEENEVNTLIRCN